MEQIKIRFESFAPDFKKEDNFFLDILKEIKQSKKNYLLFSRYMEALIAFHRYYGGRDE